MKVYLLSLGAGLLVGVIYSLVNVRSPAPPVVALVGLLGILLGEQIIPVGRQMICRNLSRRRLATVTVHAASLRSDAGPSRRAAGSQAGHRSPGGTPMNGSATAPDAPDVRPHVNTERHPEVAR